MTYLYKNKIQNLAVEKSDRLTRNLRDGVAVDDWLEADGSRILHSVKENIRLHKDSKSDVKFMWNIHLAVAKKYADNLREEAMKGWAEKLSQGWMPCPPPLGYKTVIVNGRRTHAPDPATYKAVQRGFQLYLNRSETVISVCAALNKLGLTTSRGHPLNKNTIHKMLQNPFYMGTIRFDGKLYPGSHEPIVSKKIYDAVQLKRSRKRPERLQKHNPLLKGMLTCSICGHIITWQSQKGQLYGSCQRLLEPCRKQRFVKEAVVTEQILAILDRLIAPDPQLIDWMVQQLRTGYESTINTREEGRTLLMNKIRRIESMETMLYDDKLAGEITPDTYSAKHSQFKGDLAALRYELDELDHDNQTNHLEQIKILELSQQASEQIRSQTKPVEDKRVILTKLFSSMTVIGSAVSVKLTRLAQALADKNQKILISIDNQKSTNQTQQMDQIVSDMSKN